MEIIEIADESMMINGHNLIVQPMHTHGFAPTHFFNDGSGGIEIIDDMMTPTQYGDHFLQVIDPSSHCVVNYVYGPDGSLIPIYDGFPVDNSVTILAAEPEPPSEPTIQSHILDHMYAKKPKDPNLETPAKPRKRIKKKEPPPTVVNEYIIPEIASNTTKVNIIRKGFPVTSTTAFKPLLSRPKILQPKGATNFTPAQSSVGVAASSSSHVSNGKFADVNNSKTPVKLKINNTFSQPSTSTYGCSEPKAKLFKTGESDQFAVNNSDNASFYVTTLNNQFQESDTTTMVRGSSSKKTNINNGGLRFMLPVSTSTSPFVKMEDSESTFQTFHINDSALATGTRSDRRDETMLAYTENDNEMFTDFVAEDADESVIRSETELQLATPIYFSYD